MEICTGIIIMTTRWTDADLARVKAKTLTSVTQKPDVVSAQKQLNSAINEYMDNIEMTEPYTPSKYRNKRTIGGYASIKEGKRAAQLKLMEKAGAIRNLREQVPFVLIPAQIGERPCKYIADFTYFDGAGVYIVEDVKSPASRTPEYVIKRKLLLHVHGIRIREV